jgi:nitroreductase
MKKIIRKIMPEFILVVKRRGLNFIRLLVCYIYDLKRFIIHSGTSVQNDQRKLLGKIIAHYHVIEKGISFVDMRPGFGRDVITNLIVLINRYIDKKYDRSELQFITACSVLTKYININEAVGEDLGKIKGNIPREVYELATGRFGGSQTVYRKDILDAVNIDFKSFFNSRHSIREFSDADVNNDLILDALNVAKKYPSVCNRQAIRVYLVDSKESVRKHLEYQNGNRGFREKINKLLVITADLSVFENANERNQPFIDGGIYLMGLLLSLHSQGLGAVALNWSMDVKEDKCYRYFSCIKDSEVIISFVAVGHLNDEMKIPKSERNSVDDILTVIT